MGLDYSREEAEAIPECAVFREVSVADSFRVDIQHPASFIYLSTLPSFEVAAFGVAKDIFRVPIFLKNVSEE